MVVIRASGTLDIEHCLTMRLADIGPSAERNISPS